MGHIQRRSFSTLGSLLHHLSQFELSSIARWSNISRTPIFDGRKCHHISFYCSQAVLQRTLADYKCAGFNPQSNSLEIRLIQSQEDIRNPQVIYKAERYEQSSDA
ncbi:Pyridoxal kinase [Platanthera guangdongensis]|uniref:Pyridoxal kinase n=1 Tax=Platanthera guangdongensis TaxID=2320717 RepID=A0ABR2LEB7_9ASPA